MKTWYILATMLTIIGSALFFNGLNTKNNEDAFFSFPDKKPFASNSEMNFDPVPPGELPHKDDKSNPEESSAGRPEKASTADAASTQNDRYKKLILQHLAALDWSQEYLDDVEKYLADPRAVFRPRVLHVNSTHEETKDLYSHHQTVQSVNMCMNFWNDNEDRIKTAVKPYNVPPEVVVGILKVETNFGTHSGRESVFNVFWSLALGDHPEVLEEILKENNDNRQEQRRRIIKRAKWARNQLKDLLFMAQDGHGMDPVGITGSWAGAFGLSQFIPASYRYYGRDGDGDGIINLDDLDDAAASIANYLKENGWGRAKTDEGRKKVIMRYNISSHYADCVLALADSISFRLVR